MRLWTLPALCILGTCRWVAGSQLQVEPEYAPAEEEIQEGPAEVDAGIRLELFVDGLMAAQFEAYRLAGATAAIIHGDETVLLKGYGYADLEKPRPVDPEATLFAIASITKLFTWTGLMQLAERNRLDLSADLNRYLDSLQIPETFPQPVTALNLLAHTAGFEDRRLRLFTWSAVPPESLAELLRVDLPRRVRPPGEVPAYSNHGAALAGLVIQDITGVSWAEYVERNLFEPLEMERTTVRRPVPPGWREDVARGYRFTRKGMTVQPPENVSLSPAGSALSTAADMAKFMKAHLQPERNGSGRILREETAIRMRTPLFEADSRLGGMAHGFAAGVFRGRRVFGHGGDTQLFHSGLVLVPEENLGIFLAYNAEEGFRARDEAVRALLSFFLPDEIPLAEAPLPGFADRAREIVGSYRSSRRPRTTVDKFAEIFGYLVVEVVEPGVLRTSSPGGTAQVWVEAEPYLFEARDTRERLLFRESGDGGMRAFPGNRGYFVWEKLEWWRTPGFQATLLLVNLLFLVSTFVLPALDILVNWRGERMLARREPSHSSARFLAALVGGVYLAFLAALAIGVPDPYVLLYGVPPLLAALLVLPLVGGFLTVLLVVVAALAWRGRYWGAGARLHYTGVAAAAVALLWQLNYWNLLGWRFY